MKKKNTLGLIILTLASLLVIYSCDFQQNSNDNDIVFIQSKGIESIHDLIKVESFENITILLNLWTPDSDNCLYLSENPDMTYKEMLHVFSSDKFRGENEFRKFVQKKGVHGYYLLLPPVKYTNFVRDITRSEKRIGDGYPIQSVVYNGKIIDISNSNTEH